eukprot:CAMPEP_0119190860 /NCGR_PEP_ID=MMETSP1316-20130426/1822_1 /TAXON_ID=41880 /ORGANISM="Pycnococcus provasolii, Strain RCC2336" /LENGTH=275 /DNA_ID=CAMNT_0007185811 /DNA_START=203 /DNA_END=1028 /DNA_ORIENTATION=-
MPQRKEEVLLEVKAARAELEAELLERAAARHSLDERRHGEARHRDAAEQELVVRVEAEHRALLREAEHLAPELLAILRRVQVLRVLRVQVAERLAARREARRGECSNHANLKKEQVLRLPQLQAELGVDLRDGTLAREEVLDDERGEAEHSKTSAEELVRLREASELHVVTEVLHDVRGLLLRDGTLERPVSGVVRCFLGSCFLRFRAEDHRRVRANGRLSAAGSRGTEERQSAMAEVLELRKVVDIIVVNVDVNVDVEEMKNEESSFQESSGQL